MKTPNSIVLFVLIVATTVVRHATARRQGGLRSLKATMADGDKSVYGLLVRAAPKRRTLQENDTAWHSRQVTSDMSAGYSTEEDEPTGVDEDVPVGDEEGDLVGGGESPEDNPFQSDEDEATPSNDEDQEITDKNVLPLTIDKIEDPLLDGELFQIESLDEVEEGPEEVTNEDY